MDPSETLANGKAGTAGEGFAIWPATALLKWVYLGRVSVAIAVFVAASFYFANTPPGVIVTVAVAVIMTLLFTGVSFFYTHVRGVPAGPTFLYVQAVFDLGLVTSVVHVTGGAASDFASLYIPVIAVASVTMPITSSLLLTILASALYIADVVVGTPVLLSPALWLQIGVFVTVALATSYLASRVRVVGAERRELEQEVHRLRLEAGDILRQIGSGVVTVDDDGTLVFANQAAERLLGFDVEHMAGRAFLPFLRLVAPELETAIVTTQSEGRRRLRFTGTVAGRDRTFPIGVTTTLHEVDPNGPSSVTAIFTDISDQIRLQDLNRRTERLEAVAELSASLAHEIKNPLASIRSSVEQLGRSRHANEDDQFLAELVVRESDRLSGLLTEFLDFARVRVTDSHPVDFVQLTHAAIAVVRKHPDCRENAQVTVEGQCDPIEGDEDLLHRIIVNLVLNALQATGDNAVVTVRLSDVAPAELPSSVRLGAAIMVEVSDNGPGIPDALRDRMFDPFVTGRVGGTGLGLAVVQRGVDAHRGVVFADTEAGVGTTFTVFLPKTRHTEVAA